MTTDSAEGEATDTPSGPGCRGKFSQKGSTEMNLFVLRSWLEAKFHKDEEEGASMVEYILLVALIALAVIAAVIFLGGQVHDKFNQAGSSLSSGA
jgi:Flp pilus assembly pilin Flp